MCCASSLKCITRSSTTAADKVVKQPHVSGNERVWLGIGDTVANETKRRQGLAQMGHSRSDGRGEVVFQPLIEAAGPREGPAFFVSSASTSARVTAKKASAHIAKVI